MATNDWLNTQAWDAIDSKTMALSGLTGPLRGVTEIDMGRLNRAMGCVVTPVEGGGYHVCDPKSRDKTNAGQYVHLDDPHMDRCYCEDFLKGSGAREDAEDAGEAAGRPCKHILAAVLADEKHRHMLEPFVSDLVRRNSLALAAKKAITQTPENA